MELSQEVRNVRSLYLSQWYTLIEHCVLESLLGTAVLHPLSALLSPLCDLMYSTFESHCLCILL